jgi:hypothetical protein
MQIKVLHAFNVHFHELRNAGVLRNADVGIAIAFFDFAHSVLVEPGQERFERNRVKPASQAPTKARMRFGLKEFSELMGELHAASNLGRGAQAASLQLSAACQQHSLPS